MTSLCRCVLLMAIVTPICWNYLSNESPGADEKSLLETNTPLRTDLSGDPLPSGAIARLGSTRLQYGEQAKCLAFSRDSRTLASGGGDSIRLWDVACGKLTLEIPTTEWEYKGVSCVAFSPDGKIIAALTAKGTRFWDTRTGQGIPKEEKIAFADCFVFSPDGKTVATGTGKSICIWDVTTGKRLTRLSVDDATLKHLAFSPDGKMLASGSGYEDKTVRLWDVATGKELHALTGHEGGVVGIAFGLDGKTLVSAAQQKLVRLWDVKSGKVLRQVVCGSWLTALSPDGQRTLGWKAGGDPFAVPIWDVDSGKEIFKLQGHQTPVDSAAFSSDCKLLATVGTSGAIRIWDVTTGKELSRHTGHEGRVNTLAFSQDGKTLITSSTGLLCFWDVTSAKLVREIKGEGEDFTLSRDTRTLAWRSFRDISLWDSVTGNQLGKTSEKPLGRTPEQTECKQAALSPDGRKVAGAFPGLGMVYLWNAADGRLLHIMNAELGMRSVAFSPDGEVLAAGGSRGTVFLWDTSKGKNLLQIVVPKEGAETPIVHLLAFSQDGRRLYGGSDWIDCWDVRSGKHLVRLRQRGWSVASPDGNILRVHKSGYGHKACLYEVASGEIICTLPHTGKYSGRVALAPDGRALAIANSDNTVLILDLPYLLGVDRGIKSQGLSQEVRQQLWADLAQKDASAAHRAIYTLALVPEGAVALLEKELKPTPPKNAANINQLVADLDHDQFAARQAAFGKLQALGRIVEPELRQSLQSNPPREAQRLLQELLETLYRYPVPPERLRQIRAVRALEVIGSPEALKLLESLAQGEASASLTQDARITLQRMKPE